MATTIPRKDADFHEKQAVIATTAMAKVVVWGLDMAWMETVLMPCKTEWDSAYEAYRNPIERTTLITKRKQDARKNYEPALRKLAKNLESNTRVTNADRTAMGIVSPSGNRRPIPEPTSFPDFTVNTSVIRRLSIHFRDHESLTRAKPHGMHGAEIRWEILQMPPENIQELTQSSFDTHTPFTLTFEENQRGKTVWICLRWENTTGLKGPWSEIQSAVIP
jgi:hypothetical protein